MKRKKETSSKRKIKVGATGGMMPDSRGFLVLSNLLMLLPSSLAYRALQDHITHGMDKVFWLFGRLRLI